MLNTCMTYLEFVITVRFAGQQNEIRNHLRALTYVVSKRDRVMRYGQNSVFMPEKINQSKNRASTRADL